MGFGVGDDVRWKWGSGYGDGTIIERYTDRVSKTLQGSEITRNATADAPAFLIEQDDGDRVLKSESELQ